MQKFKILLLIFLVLILGVLICFKFSLGVILMLNVLSNFEKIISLTNDLCDFLGNLVKLRSKIECS
ncbi:hypothetical protein QFZ25_001810 [Bacillus atrophaeus]|nr:hypothetical protein S101359_02030 [Bacillus atrophaeus]MDQ0927750.1 hypothetical protein [Bacillus atrophaeus]